MKRMTRAWLLLLLGVAFSPLALAGRGVGLFGDGLKLRCDLGPFPRSGAEIDCSGFGLQRSGAFFSIVRGGLKPVSVRSGRL